MMMIMMGATNGDQRITMRKEGARREKYDTHPTEYRFFEFL